MFDTVFGLPVHALVIHAVVVLLPLAALGVIAIAVVPRWRRPYGLLVVAFALVATLAVPVATRSGAELSERVGRPERHAELGLMVIWYAVPMLLLAIALVWLDRREPPSRGYTSGGGRARSRSRLTLVVAGLAVVAAVGAATLVTLAGHEGSTVVWEPIVENTGD